VYLVVPPDGLSPETRRIELGPTALTIGRAASCQIRVDVPGVDEEHARISEVALIALGADCAIGDVPLDAGSRRLVMPGDEIQIGSIVLAVEGSDPSLIPPSPDVDITHPMPGAPVRLEAPRIRVVEGSPFGDELFLREENREYVIGRGPKCDLVIEDREVSREHVKVLRKGYTIFIQDLSSTRGSWLGRSAVYTGATVEWTRPRMLRVGATVLSLELPEAIRRAAPGAQASAPMTPPPRSRKNMSGVPQATPSAPAVSSSRGNALTASPSVPPPGSGSIDPRSGVAHEAQMTHGIAPYPQPADLQAVAQHAPASGQQLPAVPAAYGSRPGLQLPNQTRKAWKKSGPTFGRASGLLLLALAGLVILGGLFVVFSLLE
jgi:pSer/pThr/pTyr-binding forkhead associated (FHA) protein